MDHLVLEFKFLCKCGFKLQNDPPYPFLCKCGTRYFNDRPPVVKSIRLQMSVQQLQEMQAKLGLTPFGIAQPEIPPLALPFFEKPTDLPPELVSWLNQYDGTGEEKK